MKIAVLLLLLFALDASAACFVHPDTGVRYCASELECAAGSVWNPATQACGAVAATTAICTGLASGAYTPAVPGQLNAFVTPTKAFWSRVGGTVSVSGTAYLNTNGAGAAVFYLSTPTGQTFATEDDAAGVGALRSEDAAGIAAVPFQSAVRVELHGAGQHYSNDVLKYTYSYRVADCP